MDYTIQSDPVINRKIEEDLKRIKNRLLDEFDGIRTMVLIGGFGRGEGKVIFENSKPQPFNDYDIVLFVEHSINRKKLKEISRHLAEKLNLIVVDFIVYLYSKLNNLSYAMLNYDMKYGGYVFYGSPSDLSLIAEMDPRDMPLIEGEILLFNRLMNLLYTHPARFYGRDPNTKEKLSIFYQCGKALIDCYTVRLIIDKQYHYSFLERGKRISKLYARDGDVISLVKQSIDFKLNTKTDMRINAIEFWHKTHSVFDEVFKQVLSHRYNENFNDWGEFVNFYVSRSLSVIVKRSANKVLRFVNDMFKTYRRRIPTDFRIAQLLILFAMKNSDINISMLQKAMNRLEYYPQKDGFELYEDLVNKCVEIWQTTH